MSFGTLDVLPFATFHDAAEPFGFLIRSRVDGEKLVFATDTVNLAYEFPGVNIVALECNYDDEILCRASRLPEKVRHRIRNSHIQRIARKQKTERCILLLRMISNYLRSRTALKHCELTGERQIRP